MNRAIRDLRVVFCVSCEFRSTSPLIVRRRFIPSFYGMCNQCSYSCKWDAACLVCSLAVSCELFSSRLLDQEMSRIRIFTVLCLADSK